MVWWEVLVQTAGLPQYMASAAMLLLAGFLLYVDFNSVTHRAFSLLLIFRAMVMLSATVRDLYVFSPPPELGGIGNATAASLWAGAAPYFVLAMPALLTRFAAVYPRRRTIFGTTTWGPALLILATVALQLLYALDHTWFQSTASQRFTGAAGTTWTATRYLYDGPFAIFLGIMYLGLALVALLLSFDHSRLPSGPRKTGVLLVAVAFIVNALFDGGLVVGTLLGIEDAGVDSIITILTLSAIVPALLALGVLARQYERVSRTERRHIRTAVILCLLAAVSGGLAGYIPVSQFGFLKLGATGFWRLWLPALVTYALVRHQLFDIDLKIKFALKQSTLAGMAFVGFVIMSETLEAIITSSSVLNDAIPERWTDLASLGIAVSLTYALNPVKHLAGHVANRAMPNTENTDEYLRRKRLEVFRATLEGAVEDGRMTEREQRLVERLRLQLGLTDEDTAPIMADVEAAYEGRTIGTPAQGTAVP